MSDAVLDHAPSLPARAVIAFGSNLGERAETLDGALADLDADGCVVVAVSPVYESVAVTLAGPDPDAPGYLNGVVLVDTILSPRDLLARLLAIELAHGRERAERWGSRTLDLDIVDYAGLVSGDPSLTLPHPRAAERSFVLVPWLDVDPDATLPGVGPVNALDAAHEPLARWRS